jgi:predicted transposase/invertase (TIGR01784 family)
MYVFRREETKDVLLDPALLQAQLVHAAQRQELALSRERFLRDQASNLEYALEQGISTGREEAKMENARAMKNLGLDGELIMKVTGLDSENVDKL